jgi:glycine/D-amino acid oxidase-like deaminating enzyme
MRATYGVHSIFTELAIRALERWRACEVEWNDQFFRPTGVMWMSSSPRGDQFARTSTVSLERRVRIEEIPVATAARLYPQIDFDGVSLIFLEPDAGYLFARRACESVVRHAVAGGVDYRCAAVVPPLPVDDTSCVDISLDDGTRLSADQYVFACGPWLGTLFPDVVGAHLTVTRQQVNYFGVPAGSSDYSQDRLPVWLDFGERLFYGIPSSHAREAFKIADDTPGPAFDPTSGDRRPSSEDVGGARAFLARRFPELANAPLVASEVCQYESTPDAHFIVDRHPTSSNVWIVGGGSGHGYKMGPAVGELVARTLIADADVDSRFALERFSSPPTGGWSEKWS